MNEPKKTLDWTDLYAMGRIDNAKRFYPISDTPAAQYINQNRYRSPSRAYPNSYAKPLLTLKFAKWLKSNYPNHAAMYGLS